jgi:hypothetical protein
MCASPQPLRVLLMSVNCCRSVSVAQHGVRLMKWLALQGRFIHVPPLEPSSMWRTDFAMPWWRDAQYEVLTHTTPPRAMFSGKIAQFPCEKTYQQPRQIQVRAHNHVVSTTMHSNMQKGKLTQECRIIHLKNMLTQQQHTLEVPEEDTLAEIRERYLSMNSHACAYLWKAFIRKQGCTDCVEPTELDMNKTLSENGLPNESASFEECGLDFSLQVPVIHLYWSDDLTVA